MRKVVTTLTQNGIFTSVLAGSITFILGFAALDHWAYGGMYTHSIEKGIELLPVLFIFTVIIGFFAEMMSLFYGLAFSQSAKVWFLNYLRVFTGIIGGFFTGMTVGAIAVLFQDFLTKMLGLVVLWR